MMESMMRWLIGFLLLAAVALGSLYLIAGRGAPPAITIDQPDRFVGLRGTLEVSVQDPPPSSLVITLQQNGKSIPLFALDAPQSAIAAAGPQGRGLHIVRPFGKQGVPDLQPGAARIIVEATRPSLLKLRTLSRTVTKDVEVRLEPPVVSAVSTHHYVNHGGAEMVVYRATPVDVASGVRVGKLEYPGFPAAGAGLANADPSLKVAFFALLHDQPLSDPILLFARDGAGNESTAPFVDDVFEKPFKKSRIELDDKFLQRVVPEIINHSPELNLAPPAAPSEVLPDFLRINGELRRMNSARIAELTAPTATTRLWSGPFVQLGNSQVEARFADQRTYVYQGKDVDQQVHLGFDLAVTSGVSVVAANAGKVVNASWLGIYGNCVIIDHGLGVASLYGHLSSIDVKVGDSVAKGQQVGRSGMTGLAGGDHLHFTMLVDAHPVNPVEWWDAHWIEDRVDRKLREAGASSATPR
jgi:murein DD-endopeptidase MepM/ murein hydrolase activator NlpD